MPKPMLGDNGHRDAAELRLVLPRAARTVGVVRHVLHDVLENIGLDAGTIAEVELAASELSANAVIHAGGADEYEVVLRFDVVGCEIVVVDHGVGFDPQSVKAASADLPHGRGLAISRAVMDDLVVESAPGMGTSVRARKRLRQTLEGTPPIGEPVNDVSAVFAAAIDRFGSGLVRIGGTIR